MKRLIIILFVVALTSSFAGAEENAMAPERIVKGVIAEGSCAVVGMSAEQSQLIALQRARAAAIEEAAGIRVTSSAIVTNARLAVDFIKTYSRGFIVNEEVEWLPLGQYQKDSRTPPIPEYRVNITADIYRPEKRIEPLGLSAKLNSLNFRSGESAVFTIRTEGKARIAIFNITADDRVVMIFPNRYVRDNIISDGRTLTFPPENSGIDLLVETIEGHERDAEAFFVVAMDERHKRDFSSLFNPSTPMSFSSFFRNYSEIADYSEDVMLTYEVVSNQ